MRKYLIWAGVAALIAVGLWAFFALGRSQTVSVAKVSRGPAVEAIYATGVVEPEIWAKVSPTLSGRLVEILARDGKTVKKGEILARLDDREAKAKIAELDARISYWREEQARQASLVQRGAASRESFEKSQSEFLAAEASLAQARQRMADLALLSPMDGTVLRQDGEIGEVVDKLQVLFWIGQQRPLRIKADVDEEDIPRVAQGQRALIKADAFPGRPLEAKVLEITPKGDPTSKSYRVWLSLPDETPVMIGMTTEINIVVREVPNVLLVPAAAVTQDGIFVVDGGRARLMQVKLGVRGKSAVEIVSGLSEGQQVVVDPASTLKDGQNIRLAPSPAPAK